MLRIRQLKTEVTADTTVIPVKIAKKLGISVNDIEEFKIVKKSLDARKKNNPFYIYEVDIKTPLEDKILKQNKSLDVIKAPHEEYNFVKPGNKVLKNRPVVVGAGPAGLFCAYILAENHYNPLIIERGESVEKRVETIEKFWKTGKLNIHSNVQFGEGGAGTFSDGKLNTLVKDKAYRGKKAFEIFVENGAPAEIMYENKPHIGTDILRDVIINMRKKIISMGGEFRYNTKFTDLEIENNTLVSIEVNNEETIPCDNLVLAIGHSARDTFQLLKDKNLNMEPKPFAVGIRIEHPQNMINESQYGKKYAKILPPASYKLTYTTKEKRGVYSFCMCPGGYVVNASSEEKCLAINGMSNYKRDTEDANSAIVVTVSPKDFGFDPLAGLAFQRTLEQKAYLIGQGKIPLQLYKDYKNNQTTTKIGSIIPITKGAYYFSNLNSIFPEYINTSLKEAIEYFGTKISGFNCDDALLFAVESRTSSPVKILRSEMGLSNIGGIYPCGEGAGYAGGITTSAMDGIKTAEHIASIYKNFTKSQ